MRRVSPGGGARLDAAAAPRPGASVYVPGPGGNGSLSRRRRSRCGYRTIVTTVSSIVSAVEITFELA
jgi:hypothetical protein